MNYFGTDGIRGQYGRDVTDYLAYKLGKVLGSGDSPIVLIARDTRVSGDNLLDACTQGVYSAGGTAINLGILPTNAVAHFVRKFGGDYGIMISASHNAPQDNGLKVFDRYGIKLCQSKQIELSLAMDNVLEGYMPPRVKEPVFYDIDNMYCQDLMAIADVNLAGINIALDCAYGASYKVAPMLFKMCGANTTAYCNRDKGDKINVNCGATHIETLAQHMMNNHCHLGFALDGDADRLAVLEGTTVLDNSAVLLCIARYMAENGILAHNKVVGTTLTNSGLEQALASHGIQLERSQVGDTNMIQHMMHNSLNLCGEESGHYILGDYATTSDALLTALLLCKIYRKHGSLIEYSSSYQPITSIKLDIDVSNVSASFSTSRELAMLASTINNNYRNSRVVLRPSGTEPKIRCYIEGDNCQEIADLISATISNG